MARRRNAPLTPALIDGRVLLVAALLVTPAAWQASQGLLSVDQVLTRYLLVALGCTAVLALVRSVWPVLAGVSVDDSPVDSASNSVDQAPTEGSGNGPDGTAASPVVGTEVSPPPG